MRYLRILGWTVAAVLAFAAIGATAAMLAFVIVYLLAGA